MEEKDNVMVGEVIRDKRKDKGYSLRKFEEISGVSYSHLSKIERGELRPTKDTLISISKTLEEDPEPLLLLAGYPTEDAKKAIYISMSPGSGKSHSAINISQGLEEVKNRPGAKSVYISQINRKHYEDSIKNIFGEYLKVKDKEDDLKKFQKWKDVIEYFEVNDLEPDEVISVFEIQDELTNEIIQITEKLNDSTQLMKMLMSSMNKNLKETKEIISKKKIKT